MLFQLCDGDISKVDEVLKIKIVEVKKWIFCRKYEAWVDDQLMPKPKGN